MLKTLRTTIIFFSLTGGIFLFSGSLVAAAPFQLPLSSLLVPVQSVDFSDLDLRDNQNRPVRNIDARREMENLFTKGLTTLLLDNLTPARREILFTLSRRWNGAFGWLTRTVAASMGAVSAWLQDRKWKLDHSPVSRIVRQMRAEVSSTWRQNDSTKFLSLLCLILASTQLLR